MPSAPTGYEAISIGYEFFDSRVESISFSSKRTPVAKDIIIFSPSGFYKQYGHDFLRSHDLLGGGSLSEWYVPEAASGRLVTDVKRRQQQLERALETGKTVVVLVPDDEEFKLGGAEYAEHNPLSVLLPLPLTLETEAAETSDLELHAGEPFASFWRAVKDQMSAAAVITEGAADVFLTIRGTDAVVGSFGTCGNGAVLFLPGILHLSGLDDDEAEYGVADGDHPDHVEFITALFDLIRAWRSGDSDAELPTWAAAYQLPAEGSLTMDLEKAQRAVERAEARVAERRRALRALHQRKLLFTGSGNALLNQVASALRALGFTAEFGPPSRSDLICTYGRRAVVLEVKGLTKSAAEKNSAQLERWVSDYYSEHDKHPKPILVVNGWRSKPLANRPPVFPDSMLEYAKRREHALVSGVQLLGAWLDAEANPERCKGIVHSLLRCVGPWDRYGDWEDTLEVADIAA